MGRHQQVKAPIRVFVPTATSMHRPPSKRRAVLFAFSFSAAFAFVLVNVVDPYSGATASPYFQVAHDRFGGQAAQALTVAGTYTNAISRDNYTITAAPPAPPEPAPAADSSVAGLSDNSGDSGDSGSFQAPAAAVPDPGSAQAYAYGAVQARGWGEDQFNCLVSLWNKESGWRVNAVNSSSGAYGIPQALPGSKMASAGPSWETNAGTQIEWGLGYISGRYGTPCGAWAHSEDLGWY